MKIEKYIDEIYILGDIHGYWDRLNEFLDIYCNKNRKVAVIVCGDFCFWEEAAPLKDIIIPDGVEIYACPGNHENWDVLDTYGYNITEMAPNIYYMPFGSIITFINNNLKVAWNFMFCGGADSIDKNHRIPHVSWWPQEVISYKDMEQLDSAEEIDVIISHTAPTLFDLGNHYKNTNTYKDPSRDALDTVLDLYKPDMWFFGHYHMLKHGKYAETLWTCLSYADDSADKWVFRFF